MKKLLSLLLAVTLAFGLTTVAFAANDKITGVLKNLDTYADASQDLNSLKPGAKVEYPLTADMFEWNSGKTTGTLKGAVTRTDISRGNIKPIISGNNTAPIKNVSIEYKTTSVTGTAPTAVIVVEIAKPLVATTTQKFDANLFLQVGNHRDSASRVRMQGFVDNVVKTLSADDDYVSIQGGAVIDPSSSIRNLEIDFGQGVIMKTNVFRGQKYYGYVSTEITVSDDRVITKYPSVRDVIHLDQVNLNKAGRYVDLSAYTGFVYGSKGTYLGKTSEYVEFSDVYYISSKDLGGTITVSGGGSTTKPPANNNTTKPPASNNTTKPPASNTTKPPAGNSTSTTGIVSKTEAITAANSAITAARGKGAKTATVVLRNKAEIDIDGLKSIHTSAANAGLASSLQADTVSGKAVVSRIVLNPANASKLTQNIKLGGHINNANVTRTTNAFNRSFKNKIAVFSFDQDGTFGMPVNVAVKINISNLDRNNLYFYSYNRATNKYYRITKPNAWIDTTGYLHFTTTLAGDIIISDGALSK